MNRIYKVVWSKAKNCYVVASELAKRNSKGSGTRSLIRAAVTLGVTAALTVGMSGSAWAGTGTIAIIEDTTQTQPAYTLQYDDTHFSGGTGNVLTINPDASIVNSISISGSTLSYTTVGNGTATQLQLPTYSQGNGIEISESNVISVKAGTNVTVDATGVNVAGTGSVEENNTELINGGTAYTELRPTTTGNYVAKTETTAANLTALDTAIGDMSGFANNNYANITTNVAQNLTALDTAIGDMSGFANNNYANITTDVAQNLTALDTALNTVDTRTKGIARSNSGEPYTTTIEGVVAVTGGDSGSLTVGGNMFTVKASDGTLTAANSKFEVLDGGLVNAANNKFKIKADGAFDAAGTKFTVDKDGNTVAAGTLNVTGATTLNDTLTVAKKATFNDDVQVDKNLDVTGNASVGGALDVTGATTLGSTLDVTGATTLKDTLTVEGDTELKSNLKVGGTALFNEGKTNQVLIDESGIRVGMSSTQIDEQGFYAGGHTWDEAMAAMGADGRIKGTQFIVNGKTYIDKDGLNANHQKIRNLAPGDITPSSTDAINGAQIYDLSQELRRVGAGAAAMANLRPVDMGNKFSVALGVGGYRDEKAMAAGLFYRPTDRIMINMSGTIGNSNNMIGGGISFALDKVVKPVGGAANAEVKALKAENAEIKAELAELKAAIKALKEAK